MNKRFIKIVCTGIIVALMVLPTAALAKQKQLPLFIKQSKEVYDPELHRMVITPVSVGDFDPLDEKIIVTVDIKEIRALKTIDLLTDPDFYMKVIINGKEFTSNVWRNTKYVEQPDWSASSEVPKDIEFVNVSIELWDKNPGIDRLCDISQDYGTYKQCRTAELTYSIASGTWWGDDSNGNQGFEGLDPSGYGRLNGCDDNSINQQDRDCELWFNINQTDYDGDGLPYWLEVNMYNTSPLIDNQGQDLNHDGIPVEWEYKFGLGYSEWHHGQEAGYYMIYDPNVWVNQTALDPDKDGLNNIEEYKTWQWGSDPFRQDLFLEVDQMAIGPNGQGAFVPTASFDRLRDSYAKHNIVFHIDEGRLGDGQRDLPFFDDISNVDLNDWYFQYFMNNDPNYWRRGIFHWGIVVYNSTWATGFTFGTEVNGTSAVDSFLISSKYMESRAKQIPIIDTLTRKTFSKEKQREMIYAGVMMHELGHSLNMRAPGVDDQLSKWPWQTDYWRFGNYKSVMNYRYVYTDLIDYSDGSHGKNDYDDWGTMDLTSFSSGHGWG